MTDLDGNFTLSWGHSEDANNYSIYQYSSFISEINASLTLVKEGIIQNNYTLNNYTLNNYLNGTYYFIIKATNLVGSTLSNCTLINISIPAPPKPPSNFTLSINAGTPDDDGNFTLFWSESIRAENYSVYQSSNFISEINSSIDLLVIGLTSNSSNIFDYVNGTYFFMIVAYNDAGFTSSNCYSVIVAIPPKSDPEVIPTFKIFGYNFWFIILITISIYIALIANLIIKKERF